MKLGNQFLGISLAVMLALGIVPVYAEVSDLSADKRMYFLNDDILFSGKVDKGTTGLVTIVIRDTLDNFVMLTQAIIEPDESFEKRVEINNKFVTHGAYNATAFILNMTAGAKTTFDVSTDGSLFIYEDEQETESEQTTITQPEPEPSGIADFVDPEKELEYYLDRYYNESAYKSWFNTNYPGLTIEEAIGYEVPEPEPVSVEPEPEPSGIADFVDPEKELEYYLDRYYNESAYKSWFDTNYPGLTIEEAIGYEEPVLESSVIPEIITEEIIPEEIIPDAEALSTPTIPADNEPTLSGETTQMILAIGGMGILLGAVYGVKRKVDSNTEQISKNRDTIKKKLLGGILSNNPSDLIRERLAKGEISVEEYHKLKKALDRD